MLMGTLIDLKVTLLEKALFQLTFLHHSVTHNLYPQSSQQCRPVLKMTRPLCHNKACLVRLGMLNITANINLRFG